MRNAHFPTTLRFLSWVTLLAWMAIPIQGAANGVVYYVAPDGRAENEGTRESPWSLTKANEALQPGDTAILLDGAYTGTPVAPARSGRPGEVITYRAANRHGARFTDMGELPESRGTVAIYISDRAHITVDGIAATDVHRWLMGVRAEYITVANCHFENGEGWINCRFERNGDGIRITNNHFSGGTDLLSLDGGDGHLVEGNFFGDATHTGLVLLGVQRSVVRNNTLANRRWRCMEVESQRHEPFRRSAYNLIEANTFDYSPCSAIQYAGSRSILRRNIIRRCLTGMNWANYLGGNTPPKKRSPEAWHNENNRFYNNVIADSGTNDLVLELIAANEAEGFPVAERVSESGVGMVFATDMVNPKIPGYEDAAYGDNLVVNNIFYRNTNVTDRVDKMGKTASRTTHISFDWNATPEHGVIRNNVIYSGSPESEVFYFCDAVYLEPPEPRNRSIADFQERYPESAQDNLAIDPGFVDPDTGNFHLLPDSPAIDAGGPLTHTTSAGEGSIVPVVDALFFTDGFGIAGADTIRVGPDRATIVEIDYDANTLTIDREIAWDAGVPVSLDYQGGAPDPGAFEAAVN